MHGRSADLALVTGGMLMSVGYRGIGGLEGMGLWGPLLFSIPLLAAWYSFERLASIRRTYEQTISALSVVPELAGLVRAGHADARRRTSRSTSAASCTCRRATSTTSAPRRCSTTSATSASTTLRCAAGRSSRAR